MPIRGGFTVYQSVLDETGLRHGNNSEQKLLIVRAMLDGLASLLRTGGYVLNPWGIEDDGV